jgi:hypothetical protein
VEWRALPFGCYSLSVPFWTTSPSSARPLAFRTRGPIAHAAASASLAWTHSQRTGPRSLNPAAPSARRNRSTALGGELSQAEGRRGRATLAGVYALRPCLKTDGGKPSRSATPSTGGSAAIRRRASADLPVRRVRAHDNSPLWRPPRFKRVVKVGCTREVTERSG